MNRKKQILCVGGGLEQDSAVRSRVAAMNPEWQVHFAESAHEGLALLEQTGFDAVAADLSLAETDGVRFLNAVKQSQPEAQRLIVSELSDRESLLKCAGVAHHCVPKPWSGESLRVVLERTFSLNIWLSNPTVRELVGRLSIVPSPPELYFEVVRLLQSPEIDLEEIGSRIARDPAMTAKLLQLANSASLGLRRKVTNAQEAVSYIGLETTRSLILLAHTFSYCEQTRLAGFSIEQLWQHSLTTGVLARRIARAEGCAAEMGDECFLAGLLHDIGKLLLAVNLPKEYAGAITRSRQEEQTIWEAEMEFFGATHSEVGAELLAIWNLPLTTVEALALHHYPSRLMSPGFSPLTAVHAANALAHELGASGNGRASAIDASYLADLELANRVEIWREACRQELETAAGNHENIH